MKKIILFSLILCGLASIAFAQTEPPDLVNYQGILRDSSDKPLDGDYDMKFYFFSADVLGDEILLDEHLVAGTGAVTVTDGLFNAHLGGGSVSDGSGPGTYSSLSAVFRDYNAVYLEVQIYNTDTILWETLSPRVRVISSAYALNSDHFDGRNSDYFIDTSSTAQTKSGQFTADASAVAGVYGIKGYGQMGGGYFEDTSASGVAYVGYGDYGINARGNFMGGFFKDLDQSGYANVGYWDRGIEAFGSNMGGYFEDTDNTGYANVGFGNYGIYAEGSYDAGFFRAAAPGGYGIEAYGNSVGGYFKDNDSSGYAYVGYGDMGIEARGSVGGGYFRDIDGTSYTYVAYQEYGIDARGSLVGGHFQDIDSTGVADIAYGNYGVYASGSSAGGHFSDSGATGVADIGYGNYGVYASGSSAGGRFADSDSTGVAYAGYGNYGVYAYASYAGGYFEDDDSLNYCRAGYSTYKTQGTGTNAFVQNHPYESDKVIVYNSPEGDEVATYTRGTARLINGIARIQLGDTFKWVTNPDIGLTAFMAPHGDCQGLYIESLTTDELVVRESNAGQSDMHFDYIVYGLRIGFEEVSIVQKKQQESWIPSMKDHRDLYASNPELQVYNAMEQFKKMKIEIGQTEALDLSRSLALKNAVHEYDPVIDGSAGENRPGRPEAPLPPEPEDLIVPQEIAEQRVQVAERHERDSSKSIDETIGLPMDDEGNIYGRSFRPSSPDLASSLQVAEGAEAGDVLVADPDQPGLFRLAYRAYDPGVVGVVSGEPGVVLGSKRAGVQSSQSDEQEEMEMEAQQEVPEEILEEAYPAQIPVSMSGIVLCKVDASYGSISVGDLLTTSPTMGYAMRADDRILGTILGKALEPLDGGTGLIKVLVMMR